MGFFSNFFGKKDEVAELLAQIRSNQKRIQVSANYQFCCVALRDVFYETNFSREQFSKNKQLLDELVLRAIDICSKMKGVRVPPEYKNLHTNFVCDEKKEKLGFVLELPDARYECECNFVALLFEGSNKRYYTNEYYATDNSFSLGMFVDKDHVSFTDSPRNLDEFIQAIIK